MNGDGTDEWSGWCRGDRKQQRMVRMAQKTPEAERLVWHRKQ